MKTRIYKVKYEKRIQDFFQLGYFEMPKEIVKKDDVIFKLKKVEKDSDLVKMVLSIYNEPAWQEQNIINDEILNAYNQVGIFFEEVYDENGEMKKVVVENDELLQMISTWRIEIDFEDKILGLTTGDMSFPYTFTNKDFIDRFCEEEINELFENGLIKIEEIDEEE